MPEFVYTALGLLIAVGGAVWLAAAPLTRAVRATRRALTPVTRLLRHRRHPQR